jgi:hypothetical protein
MPGLTQRTKSLEPGTPHKVIVRIGGISLDWLSVPTPIPKLVFPDDETRYELTVYLFAPAISAVPLRDTLSLGVNGDSSLAEFEVDVPVDVDAVDATILVFRGTTHLQTATLRGPVAAGDVAVDGRSLQFLPGDRSEVDLATHKDPELSLTVTSDGVVVKSPAFPEYRVDLPGLDAAVAPLRDLLHKVATQLEGLGQRLTSDNGTRLVRTLAIQGEYLRRRILPDDLGRVASVQVTSPSSGRFLPVEFFYDYGRPDDAAALCPAFMTGTDTDCPDCRAVGDSAFVCPSGFWALRTSIERQVRSLSAPGCSAPEPRPEERLPATSRIVFAASDRVNTTDQPDRIAATIAALEALNAEVHRAATWNEWQKLVMDWPMLLVALPHTVDTDTGFQALQVGPEDERIELRLNAIDPTYLGPPDQRPGPVVLLLGCNVANPKVAYQDFVRELRCSGASLVVGTLTYVLGQQAAPFATALVQALLDDQTDDEIGTIMRKVRARMLRQDNPMALAVTAYGAADWRFQTGHD